MEVAAVDRDGAVVGVKLDGFAEDQLPDLSFTGIDVGLSPATLADDFKCTETGPIRLICIWGSFLDDAVCLASAGADWREMRYPDRHAFKGESLDLAFVISSGGETHPAYDLGDAPDSSNSFPGATMLAYPSGVVANFPTVYHAGSPPYGPVHRRPRDMFFLGKAVTVETEADLGLDEDAVNNLDPPKDAANRDNADDGLHLPVVMPPCRVATLNYTVTVVSPTPRLAFVNVWCDWNRDGDWDDTLLCPDGTAVSEWAVQNHIPALPGAGTYVFTSPLFMCWHPAAGAQVLRAREELDRSGVLPDVHAGDEPAAHLTAYKQHPVSRCSDDVSGGLDPVPAGRDTLSQC